MYLLCNDRRRLTIQHFVENERNFCVLTLDDSRYIYTLIYPCTWGIVGRVIKKAFVVLVIVDQKWLSNNL